MPAAFDLRMAGLMREDIISLSDMQTTFHGKGGNWLDAKMIKSGDG